MIDTPPCSEERELDAESAAFARRAFGSDLPSWQHDIEHNEIRRTLQSAIESVAAAGRNGDAIVFIGEHAP